MTEPEVPPTGPGAEGVAAPDGAAADPSGDAPARRSRPVVRWIQRLPAWVWAAVVVAAVVIGLLVVVVANPGHRIGPVRPAEPPVGGTALPATRLV